MAMGEGPGPAGECGVHNPVVRTGASSGKKWRAGAAAAAGMTLLACLLLGNYGGGEERLRGGRSSELLGDQDGAWSASGEWAGSWSDDKMFRRKLLPAKTAATDGFAAAYNAAHPLRLMRVAQTQDVVVQPSPAIELKPARGAGYYPQPAVPTAQIINAGQPQQQVYRVVERMPAPVAEQPQEDKEPLTQYVMSGGRVIGTTSSATSAVPQPHYVVSSSPAVHMVSSTSAGPHAVSSGPAAVDATGQPIAGSYVIDGGSQPQPQPQQVVSVAPAAATTAGYSIVEQQPQPQYRIVSSASPSPQYVMQQQGAVTGQPVVVVQGPANYESQPASFQAPESAPEDRAGFWSEPPQAANNAAAAAQQGFAQVAVPPQEEEEEGGEVVEEPEEAQEGGEGEEAVPGGEVVEEEPKGEEAGAETGQGEEEEGGEPAAEPAATEEEPATTEEEPAAEPAATEEEPAATEEEPATTEEEPAAADGDAAGEEWGKAPPPAKAAVGSQAAPKAAAASPAK